MVKTLASILIIFSFLLYNFSKLGVYANYELHKDYIAKVLCVNKNKPSLNCNGKCFLKRKMKQDTQQKENSSPNSHRENISLPYIKSETVADLPNIEILAEKNALYLLKDYATPELELFHPPRFI